MKNEDPQEKINKIKLILPKWEPTDGLSLLHLSPPSAALMIPHYEVGLPVSNAEASTPALLRASTPILPGSQKGMACAPHTHQSVQLSLRVTLPQGGQYSLIPVCRSTYLRDSHYMHFILLRWSWDHGESLHLCILMLPPRRCLCQWRSRSPGQQTCSKCSNLLHSHYEHWRHDLEALEDAWRRPSSRHSIRSGRLRKHWGQEATSLAYAMALVFPRAAQGWAQAAVTSKLHADLGRACLIMGLPKGLQTKAWGESPSTFLKRVFEAYKKYTTIYFLKTTENGRVVGNNNISIGWDCFESL